MPRARLVFDGDGVYTEKEARIHKLTQETENKIDNIPGVVDDVNSTSTTDALSANMGKRLQDQINQLTGLNKFLSTWDCTTGLPVTDPSATPFTYASGNYYLVATVAGEGGTNYKPHGSTFTPGVASTAVETNEVNVNDMYIFDGSQWILQVNKVKEIIVDDGLSPDSTNAVENRAIYNALTTKQNNILDLANIRAGAALGMTSIQPGDNITELTNNVGYQTAGDVAIAIEDAIEELAPEGVGTGVLTLQKNSTTLDTFSANAAQDKTINISVPTTVAELSDASDYVTDTELSTTLEGYVTDTELSTTLEDYATKDYVDGNVIHSGPTAPSPAEEGMLWYDTANDVLKVYDGTQWNLTGKVYSSGTGINVDNTNDTISNTGVLSVNGSTGVITGIATEQYVDSAVDEAVEDSKYVGPTAPSNPTEGMLWYDTTNDILKVWDGDSWEIVGDGDMRYADFNFESKTGATITLGLSTAIVPASNFTINAPATIKDGQTYILRINNDSIAYTMTLGTNVTNPYEEDLSLTPYGIDQFTFLAIGGNLELQPGGTSQKYTAGDGIEINNNEISVDRQVITNISASGGSMGAFVNACKANGTLHTTNFSGAITYTFKGLGFVKVGMMHGYALSLNDVEMFNYYFTSGNYHDEYFLGPYTASAGDVLKVWIPGSQGTIGGTIYDYYNE